MTFPIVVREGSRSGSLSGDRLLAAIDVLNDQLTIRGQQAFLRQINRLVDDPEFKRLVSLTRADRMGEALEVIDNIDISTADLDRIFLQAFRSGGRAASRVADEVYNFDPRNPRVFEWLASRSGTSIAEINGRTRDGVRQLLLQGMEQGLSPREIGQQVSDQVGLTFRQMGAVDNYRQRLINRGIPNARANRMAREYAGSLRSSRGATIARTELTAALEAGKDEYWHQAVDAGIIDPNKVVRVWVAENDERVDQPCEMMDGIEVGFYEPFQTAIGAVRFPPIHPNCRCGVVLQSGRRRRNLATSDKDRRVGSGQSTNRFVNLRSGATMGKSETGDTYEMILFNRGYDELTRRFGPGLRQTAGKGTRTHPVDFEFDNWAAEVKTIHVNSANKKTAIKVEERVRKLAYSVGDDADRIVARMNEGAINPREALDEVLNMASRQGFNQEPLLLVQEVDDVAQRVTVYAWRGDFPSKAIGRMEELFDYTFDERDFLRAQEMTGHGGVKAERRAVQDALKRASAKMDELEWNPMMRGDNVTPNPAIQTALRGYEELEDVFGNRLKPIWEVDSADEFIRNSEYYPGFKYKGRATSAQASAMPYKGEIHLYDNFFEIGTNELRRQTVMHEVGHSLEEWVYGKADLWQQWESLTIKRTGAIIYPTSGYEALAEAYAHVWYAPDWLKTNFREAYDFVVGMAKTLDFPLPPGIKKYGMIVAGPDPIPWLCGHRKPDQFDSWGELIESNDHVIDISGPVIYEVVIEEPPRLRL